MVRYVDFFFLGEICGLFCRREIDVMRYVDFSFRREIVIQGQLNFLGIRVMGIF